MKSRQPAWLLALMVSLLALGGCEQPQDNGASGKPPAHDDHDHDHGHDHGSDGHDHDHDQGEAAHAAPHGGHLIEMGHEHQFHAELVEDQDAGALTIHFYDGDLQPLAVDPQTVTLVVTAGDQVLTVQFSEAGTEPVAQLVHRDAALLTALKADAAVKLRASMGGKAFTGTMDHHDHDHGTR